MKRISILFVLLAFGVAACGEQASSQTDAAAAAPSATAEPTAEPTTAAEPSDEPDESADAGDGTALADLIPDELNGVAGVSNPAMNDFMAAMLQQQGMDAENFEFEFVTYGSDADALVLTAFRIPGVTEASLEVLARMMSGVEGAEGVETQTVDLGGKSVLRMSAPAGGTGQEGAVFMYFAEEAAFTIVSPTGDESAVGQLLAELP